MRALSLIRERKSMGTYALEDTKEASSQAVCEVKRMFITTEMILWRALLFCLCSPVTTVMTRLEIRYKMVIRSK